MIFTAQDLVVNVGLAAAFGALVGMWATRAYFIGQFRGDSPKAVFLDVIQRYAETANDLANRVSRLRGLSADIGAVAGELGQMKADIERAVGPLETIRRELKWSADATSMPAVDASSTAAKAAAPPRSTALRAVPLPR